MQKKGVETGKAGNKFGNKKSKNIPARIQAMTLGLQLSFDLMDGLVNKQICMQEIFKCRCHYLQAQRQCAKSNHMTRIKIRLQSLCKGELERNSLAIYILKSEIPSELFLHQFLLVKKL